MIPIIAGISAVSGLISAISNARKSAPVQQPTGDFRAELNRQVGQSSASRKPTFQSLLAMQKAGGPLGIDQQFILSQHLLNKTVQVKDPAGNSVIGMVTDAQLAGGQMFVAIRGQLYPVSSVQAVLNGVGAAS